VCPHRRLQPMLPTTSLPSKNSARVSSGRGVDASFTSPWRFTRSVIRSSGVIGLPPFPIAVPAKPHSPRFVPAFPEPAKSIGNYHCGDPENCSPECPSEQRKRNDAQRFNESLAPRGMVNPTRRTRHRAGSGIEVDQGERHQGKTNRTDPYPIPQVTRHIVSALRPSTSSVRLFHDLCNPGRRHLPFVGRVHPEDVRAISAAAVFDPEAERVCRAGPSGSAPHPR